MECNITPPKVFAASSIGVLLPPQGRRGIERCFTPCTKLLVETPLVRYVDPSLFCHKSVFSSLLVSHVKTICKSFEVNPPFEGQPSSQFYWYSRVKKGQFWIIQALSEQHLALLLCCDTNLLGCPAKQTVKVRSGANGKRHRPQKDLHVIEGRLLEGPRVVGGRTEGSKPSGRAPLPSPPLMRREGRQPARGHTYGSGKGRRETLRRSFLVPDISPMPGQPEAMARASMEAAMNMPLLEVVARYHTFTALGIHYPIPRQGHILVGDGCKRFRLSEIAHKVFSSNL